MHSVIEFYKICKQLGAFAPDTDINYKWRDSMTISQEIDGTWTACAKYKGGIYLGYGPTRKEAMNYCLEALANVGK